MRPAACCWPSSGILQLKVKQTKKKKVKKTEKLLLFSAEKTFELPKGRSKQPSGKSSRLFGFSSQVLNNGYGHCCSICCCRPISAVWLVNEALKMMRVIKVTCFSFIPTVVLLLLGGAAAIREVSHTHAPSAAPLLLTQVSKVRVGGFSGGACVQRQQLRDATHKVVLLCTAAAGLAPVLQNLFQLSHPQFLQVNRGQVQLLLCRREKGAE